jgi:hypothetical protein
MLLQTASHRAKTVGSVLSAPDQTRVLEDAQMFRDIRLGRADGRDEIGHVSLAALQCLQELDADRLAERAEARRNQIDGVDEQRLVFRSLCRHRRAPLTAGQILLNNFLSDIPAIGIADDAVDREFVACPRRWDMPFIARFMIEFGILSSLFDLLTFALSCSRSARKPSRSAPRGSSSRS